MFERYKANALFTNFLKRPDINKAYAMVGPENPWYDTITTVHNSLAQIQELPHEDWQITSHDGLTLKAVYYPNGSDKTLIWVHGYTSHAERETAFPALFYRSLGFNVLVPYLRAHGPSAGEYISFGALESQDMVLWTRQVNKVHPNGDIFVHGLSMGGGTILYMCNQEMENVRGLVVDAPSFNIKSTFRKVIDGAFKDDPKKDKLLHFMLKRFRKEFGVDASDYDGFEIIRESKYPILLMAGSIEKMDSGLEELAKNNPKETTVLILPGCNHGNGIYKQTELYQNTIKQFVSQNTTVR